MKRMSEQLGKIDFKQAAEWGKSATVNFGITAKDYANYRAGFPAETWVRLSSFGVGLPSQSILDLGAGTGTVARGLAKRGCRVTALDPSAALLEQCKSFEEQELQEDENKDERHRIVYVEAKAEDTTLPDDSFDAVVAGQCWHWFDSSLALKEIERILKPGGKLVICHFDWLPIRGSLAQATEELVIKHRPDWPLGGTTGLYPLWTIQAAEANYTDIETFSFDTKVLYSHEAFRGRMRAHAAIAASQSAEKVEQFDKELKQLLDERFPQEPLIVPHRVWAMIANRPN